MLPLSQIAAGLPPQGIQGQGQVIGIARKPCGSGLHISKQGMKGHWDWDARLLYEKGQEANLLRIY